MLCLRSVWGNSVRFRILTELCESSWLHSYLPSSFMPGSYLNRTLFVWQVTKQSAKALRLLVSSALGYCITATVMTRGSVVCHCPSPIDIAFSDTTDRISAKLWHAYLSIISQDHLLFFMFFFFVFVNMGPNGRKCFKQNLRWKSTSDSLSRIMHAPGDGPYQSCSKNSEASKLGFLPIFCHFR